MEGLEKEGPNKTILVPIGGGSYVKAKLERIDKVIAGVGAQVAVERTLEETKENVKKRLEEIKKNKEGLSQQLNDVLKRVQDYRLTLQDLSNRLSQKERSSPVRKVKSRT